MQVQILEQLAHPATLPKQEQCDPGALCQRCEVVPPPLTGRGNLYLSAPVTHSFGKILAWLARSPFPHTRRDGQVCVAVPDGALGGLLKAVEGVLTSVERRDTCGLLQTAGELLRTEDFFRAEPLDTILAREACGWLQDMLRGDGIRSHFQPIVGCGNGTDIHGYECLMWGEQDGGVVIAGRVTAASFLARSHCRHQSLAGSV